MRLLPILWLRFVNSEGKTCDRCHATYEQMLRATNKLKQCLHPLGIEPKLEIKQIDEKAFKANPSESNRIWIAGRPIEEWLNASIGSTSCCSVCGKSQCRTIQIGNNIFETIPENVVISAALAASSLMLLHETDQ